MGVFLIWEMTAMIQFHGDLYASEGFHFKYPFATWVPHPGHSMTILLMVICLASAFFVAIGLFYRVMTVVSFFSTTWLFLLDTTLFQHNLYLQLLFSFFMMFLPLHRAGSADAARNPSIRMGAFPRWWLWLICFQVAVVYVFSGLAKMRSDWLCGGAIYTWMQRNADLPVVGEWISTLEAARLMAWSGMLYDTLIIPLLLWRRTRVLGILMACGFHLTNASLITFYSLTWLFIFSCLMFLRPDWPRRIPLAGPWLSRTFFPKFQPQHAADKRMFRFPPWHQVLIGAYILLQLWLPLRHYFLVGNVHWTDEGSRFGHHLRSRHKNGSHHFVVVDSTGKRQRVITAQFLHPDQRGYESNDADNLLQYAHYLGRAYDDSLGGRHQVFAVGRLSLDGRESQEFVLGTLDLMTVERKWWAGSDWVVPLVDCEPCAQHKRSESQTRIQRQKHP